MRFTDILFIIVILVLVGYGVFFYMKSQLAKDINELEKAALELAALYKKVKDMASAQDFGIELDDYDGEVRLEDWLNSSCYGEEAGRTFVAHPDGKIWYPSSC